MALGTREILQQSGILNNWLGEGNSKYNAPTQVAPTKQSTFSNIVRGAGAVAGALGGAVVDGIKGVPNLIAGTQRNMGLDSRQATTEGKRKALETRDMQNHQDYKSGKISKDQWVKNNHALLGEYQGVSDEAKGIQHDYYGAGAVAKDYSSAAALALAAAGGAGVEAGAGLLAGVPGATKAAQLAESAIALNKPATSLVQAPMTAAKALLKNTLVTQPVAQAGTEIAQGKNVPMNVAALAAPGLIAGGAKYLPKLGEALNTAMYGKEGFFTAVAKNGGPDMLGHLDSLTGTASKKLENTMRQVQDYNLQQFNGNAKAAGAHFVDYLNTKGKSVDKLTPGELATNLSDWVKANEKVTALGKDGKLFTGPGGKPFEVPKGHTLIAGRFDQTEAKNLIERLKMADSSDGRKNILNTIKITNPDWSKNPHVAEQIYTAAMSPDFEKGIRKIGTMRSLFVDGKSVKLPGGYIPTVSKSTRAEFQAAKDTAALDRGNAAAPVIGKVGAALDKAGLSTESNDPGTSIRFKQGLDGELLKVKGLQMSADDVVHAIREKTKGMRGITDERQMPIESIKDALKITESQARGVKKAYLEAYSNMKAGDIGLAGKVENGLYKMPGYGTYRRIQGLLRYEMNPAFRVQEHSESEILSQIVSGGKELNAPGSKVIDRIFNGGKGTDKLDTTINLLKENKVISDSGFGGVGAAENNFAEVSARLGKGQERSLAGLVNTMAEKAGKKPADFIADMSPTDLNTVRTIVEYPKQGFTSSNFAKAMNLVIFPSRYNVKLATVLGKALADAPATVQIATMKGAADLSNFMNSDEGIKWQSDNSEVLGILGYINPLSNLGGVYKALQGHSEGLSDFGSIGGLPLGAVTQILKTTGAVPKGDAPYLNPKTGEVVPERVPTGLAGGVKLALQDLVGSMYSFPGRTLGTDMSKRQLTEGILPVLKPGKTESRPVTRTDTTPAQQRTQRVLSSGASSNKPATLPSKPGPARTLQIKPIKYVPSSASTKPRRPKVYGKRPS